MTIIKHGDTYCECKCRHCNSLLGYIESDIKTCYYDDPFGEENWAYIYYVDCPECENRIVLKEVINGKETIRG